MKDFLFIILIFCSSLSFAQKKFPATTTDTTFYPSGKIHYVTYRINGEVFKDIFYYENSGAKLAEHAFINGVLHGTSYIFYESGVIREKHINKGGKLNGKKELYCQNGVMKFEGMYKENVADGNWFWFDSLGRKTKQQKYVNNKMEGTYITYYSDGNIALKSLYSDDKRTGMAKAYYPNGKIKFQMGYKKGYMNGLRQFYDTNGAPYNGHFVSFTPDSLIKTECDCIQGKPQKEIRVYDNNRLVLLAEFKNGLPHGATYHFDINGNITKTEWYNEGKFVKEENLKKEKVKNKKESYGDD